MGFSIIPEAGNQIKDRLETLKKDSIHMVKRSQVEFMERDKDSVTIKASVPSGLFDAYLSETAELFEDGPGRDMMEWGQMLKERKTQGETQGIFFTIDKRLHITEARVEDLADMRLALKPQEELWLEGKITL